MCGQFAVLHNDAYDVLGYVKPNKNDAADAEAICEAARRPTMRFVRAKSAEQQGQADAASSTRSSPATTDPGDRRVAGACG